MSSFYDSYDIFAADIPSFNVEGQRKKGTFVGCIFTVLAGIILSLSLALQFSVDNTTTSTYLHW